MATRPHVTDDPRHLCPWTREKADQVMSIPLMLLGYARNRFLEELKGSQNDAFISARDTQTTN